MSLQNDADATPARPVGRPRTVTDEQLALARILNEAGWQRKRIEQHLGLSRGILSRHLGRRHRDGEWTDRFGHATVLPTDPAERTFPTSRKSGQIRRSHLVWNRAHPDDLVQPGQEMHHVNRDPGDDRIENLEKLSPAEHHERHREERSERRRAQNLLPEVRAASAANLRANRAPPKLSADQVDEIRERFAAGGVSKAQLGREYGVSGMQIGRIVRGERWNEAAAAARRAVP